MDIKKIMLLVGALLIAGVTAIMAKNMFAGSAATASMTPLTGTPTCCWIIRTDCWSYVALNASASASCSTKAGCAWRRGR